jgi:membrane protein YqaA with SNARE-associated domain
LKAVFLALYQLVLGLGGPGLLVLALLDSSFLSIPEGNDLLIIVLSMGGSWSNMVYYATMTTVGSVIGCSLLYWVGTRGGSYVERRLHRPRMRRIQSLYERRGVLAVIIPSLLPPPTPFKVFVLSAGAFGLAYPQFLLAVAFGRSLRYFTWGALAVMYGKRAEVFLHEHFRSVGVVVLVLILALLLWFLVLKPRVGRGESGE